MTDVMEYFFFIYEAGLQNIPNQAVHLRPAYHLGCMFQGTITPCT